MFLVPFFRLAAVSPARCRTFRCLLGAHLGLLALAALSCGTVHGSRMMLGNVLLVAGIVEGALLLGWRLTQIPKSQALEFLLVSPLRPPWVFVAEACVGIVRLGMLALASVPILALLVARGAVLAGDLPTLALVPLIWGTVTGLGLAAWAYEPPALRRIWERAAIAGLIVYLLVGVLAGENLPRWLSVLPSDMSRGLLDAMRALHEFNPFGVVRFAMEETPAVAWPRVAGVNALGLLLCCGLMVRGAMRLHGHFQDEHYRPALIKDKRPRPNVGDEPLAWWAVKRVTQFSGRINLWLAGGFALLYAAYIVLQNVWPSWLGRQVFVVFDNMGGIPALTTGLVVLAAVPAAYQYGLWDSNVPDRCRRLELLLLTDLDGPAYWQASAPRPGIAGRAICAGLGFMGRRIVVGANGLDASDRRRRGRRDLVGPILHARVLGLFPGIARQFAGVRLNARTALGNGPRYPGGLGDGRGVAAARQRLRPVDKCLGLELDRRHCHGRWSGAAPGAVVAIPV